MTTPQMDPSHRPPRSDTVPLGHGTDVHFPPHDEGAPRGSGTWKAVYTIIDRGRGRRVWLRIGVAFVNRDQSLNVRLDAVPVNGQLHIRDVPPRDGREGADTAPAAPLAPFTEEREPPAGPLWREQ